MVDDNLTKCVEITTSRDCHRLNKNCRALSYQLTSSVPSPDSFGTHDTDFFIAHRIALTDEASLRHLTGRLVIPRFLSDRLGRERELVRRSLGKRYIE
jgi:hypothetical protein